MMKKLFSVDDIKDLMIADNFIGKGGNGVVYKIPNSNYVVKKLKLKFSKNGKRLSGKKEQRKYIRFKDEIAIVEKHQTKINGILPIIQKSELPENPSKTDLIFYIMPFATSINIVQFKTIEDVIKCFKSLYQSLYGLHKAGIGHRDIKPLNIYVLNDEYYFSDFGLVSYPEKKNLTFDEKKVGPWTTIAPEMERNPDGADSEKADIYSIAKTFWMILTGNMESFEGQYSHLDKSISINNHLQDFENCEYTHLGIVNDIMRRSTSNNPDDRPCAKELLELLTILGSGDSKKICEYEWSYLLDDLVLCSPRIIKWEAFDSISTVLNRVALTHSLNHMFLPSGGGMDLEGVKPYKNQYLEMDIGYKRIVKPKLLQLNVYSNPMFNHFYLETSPIQIQRNDDSIDEEYGYSDRYLQIDEDRYVETWWENYDFYEGEPIANKDIVVVSHKGAYVIFPKISFYNLDIDKCRFELNGYNCFFDPYDALHEKIGSAAKFDVFMQDVIGLMDTGKIPKKIIDLYAKKNKIIDPDPNYKTLKASFEDYIQGLNICEKYDFNNTVNDQKSNFKYHVYVQIGLETYAISKEQKLQKIKTTFSMEDILERGDKSRRVSEWIYEFESYASAKELSLTLKELIETENYKSIGVTDINPFLKKRRVKSVKKAFYSKSEIEKVLKTGDDCKGGYIVLDECFDLKMVPCEKYDDQINNYSVKLGLIPEHSNILGPQENSRAKDYLESNYNVFLNKILLHLKTCPSGKPA